MPLIVDKEAMRMEILMAFQRCIEKKPLTKVSLRDIAAEAGMSHAKLLNYFESRDDLVVTFPEKSTSRDADALYTLVAYSIIP